jgi:hypothetical protein
MANPVATIAVATRGALLDIMDIWGDLRMFLVNVIDQNTFSRTCRPVQCRPAAPFETSNLTTQLVPPRVRCPVRERQPPALVLLQ